MAIVIKRAIRAAIALGQWPRRGQELTMRTNPDFSPQRHLALAIIFGFDLNPSLVTIMPIAHLVCRSLLCRINKF